MVPLYFLPQRDVKGKPEQTVLSTGWLEALFFKDKVEREGERRRAMYACHRKISIVRTPWCLRRTLYPELLADLHSHRGGKGYCTARLLETVSLPGAAVDLDFLSPLGTWRHPCCPVCLQISLEDGTLLQLRHQMPGWVPDSMLVFIKSS